MGLLIGYTVGVIILVTLFWIFTRTLHSRKIIKRNEKSFNTILSTKDLAPDKIIFSTPDRSRNSLSINEAKHKVSYGYIEDNQHLSKEYDFSDIASFEVHVDDQKISEVSSGGVVVGADDLRTAIGYESEEQNTKVKSVFFLINIGSKSDPIIKLKILAPSSINKGWKSNSLVIQNAIEQAKKWTDIFTVILKEKG